MKVFKIILSTILTLLLLISAVQIFPVYPYADKVYSLYRSTYFNEMDDSFRVIADSFLEVKMMKDPLSKNEQKSEYSWILLDDIKRKHGITVKVYNGRGDYVPYPGKKSQNDDPIVKKILSSGDFNPVSKISGKIYYYAYPVNFEDKCYICHSEMVGKKEAGILTFRKKFKANPYYTTERAIIFSVISLALAILLFFTIRWDPESDVRKIWSGPDEE